MRLALCEVDIVPAQRHHLGGAQAVPVGNQQLGSPFTTAGFRKMVARLGVVAKFKFPVHPHMHGGVAVAVPVVPGRLHEPLDLGLREIFAGPQLDIGTTAGWVNCPIYGRWRHQLQGRFCHDNLLPQCASVP